MLKHVIIVRRVVFEIEIRMFKNITIVSVIVQVDLVAGNPESANSEKTRRKKLNNFIITFSPLTSVNPAMRLFARS